MSWSFFPISLKGDRSHLPLVQNLEFILSDQLAFHHDLGFDWLKIISWNLVVVFSFLFVKK